MAVLIRRKLITETSEMLSEKITQMFETKPLNLYPRELFKDFLRGEINLLLEQYIRLESERARNALMIDAERN